MVTRRTVLAGSGLMALATAIPASAKEDSEAIKAAALRWITEVLNGQNYGVLDEIVSPDYVSPNADDAPGIDALKSRVQSARESDGYSVKDPKYTTEDSAVKSPNVFIRGSITGANDRGKNIHATFFAEFVFSGGLIVSHYFLEDQTALYGI